MLRSADTMCFVAIANCPILQTSWKCSLQLSPLSQVNPKEQQSERNLQQIKYYWIMCQEKNNKTTKKTSVSVARKC